MELIGILELYRVFVCCNYLYTDEGVQVYSPLNRGVQMKSTLSLIAIFSLCLLSANVCANNNPLPKNERSMPTISAKNKAAGEAFLAANKTKTGVFTLADGLQYKAINEGRGIKPTDNDIVMVDYSGTFVDGTEFDSSYKRGQPASFPVGGVIPGWTEALKLMKVGSTWELYIPPSLAYGERGAPPLIGPNQTLIFRVTLISVKKP